MNNPMSGSDPSGFGWLANISVGDAVGAAVIAGHAVSYGILLGNSDSLAGASPTSAGSITTGSIAGGGLGVGQAAYGLATSGNGGNAAPTGELGGGAQQATGNGLSQGGMGAKTGSASQGASPGGPRLQIQTDQNGWYVYQQLPPELVEELGPILQPLLQQGGLSINDIRVVARPLEGDPGLQENGRVIQIDPRGLDAGDERGLVAHEIVHVVQRRLLGTTSLVEPGTAGIDLLGDLEHASWGRNARNLGLWYRFGLNQPLTQLNVIDPRYPIEATATHVQRVVLDAF